ncbi:hypothetical protein M1494_02850 [Candidatus Parvarchaeota archaeon]|nr:hypothetical protein [Candidatus Parvarchaeota archaeon]
MMKYRILSKKRSENGQVIALAVNYISPSMVKILLNKKLKVNSIVQVDNDIAYYQKRYLGKVLESRDVSDMVINTDYSIKYTGGYSVDSRRIFLDKNFPKLIAVNNKLVDTVESIAKHHEVTEKWLVDFGHSYAYSHRLATSIEKDFIKFLGVKWDQYDREVGKYLHENYNRKLENTPLDLDLLPYIESRDSKALKEIKESMNTAILDIVQYER